MGEVRGDVGKGEGKFTLPTPKQDRKFPVAVKILSGFSS